MIKLSASRKKFILELFAVLVVCAFLATSLVPSIGHSGTGVNTNPIYDVHSSPPLSNNNNSSSAGYVKYTLILSNNTLVNGNFINSGNFVEPRDATFDSSNGYVYVANAGSNSVSVLNGTTNKVIDTIPVGSDPLGVSFDSSNGYVYVANGCSKNVSVINGATNTVINTIPVGSVPCGVSFDSSNGYVYVANAGSNSVSVINGTTNKVIDTIPVGSDPQGVSFDSSNGYVYVTNFGSNSVSVINGATNTVIDTIMVGSYPDAVAFDSSNGYVYVANSNSSSVSVINGATNTVIDTIMVGSYPWGISFDSSNGYVYVTNEVSDSVSVINGATNKVIDNIAVGSSPEGVSFDSSNGYVYVTNFNSGTISIIATPTTTSVSKYTVTFTETGLPSATTWYVNLSNGVDSGAITGTSYTFSLTNGSYTYSISNVSGYSVSKSSGSVTVNGSNITVPLTFTTVKMIKVLSKYSGFLFENISLTDTIGVYSHWGSSFSVSVNGTMDGSNISFAPPVNQGGPWNYTFSVLNIPKNNSVTVYAYYQNGSMLKSVYNFTAISIPSEIANLLIYSNVMKVHTYANNEWSNSYSIQTDILLNFGTIASVNISNIPLIGGTYSILPSVIISFNLSSTGNASLSAVLSANFKDIDIGPVGIAAHFDLSATGILQITNDTLIFNKADLSINAGGSFSVSVPTPFGLNISGVSIGITVTLMVSPDVALNAIISATNNTTKEFIKGLGLTIDNITSQISLPFTVEGTASAVIASVSLGGTLTVNFNLGSGSPLMKGGNLTGVVFVALHALFWSDQIDLLGPGTLYSWNATDPVANYTNSYGSFVITSEYWNVSGYNSLVWKNGSLHGTVMHNIYPQTSVYSVRDGSSSYFAYTYDNVSRNLTRAIEINGFIIRNNDYQPWNIPVENGENAFSPFIASLPNGSLLMVWHAIPYNESANDPLSWNYIPVQYAYFNTSTGRWSSVMNLTSSGVAQSVAVSTYSDKVMVSVDVSPSLFSNYSYLEIYSLGSKNIEYEIKLPAIASISGFSAQSSIVVLKYLNGTNEALNISTGSEISLPSLQNYTVTEVGIMGKTNSTLYILYRSNNSSLAVLYDPYSNSMLEEITLNSSVESIIFQEVGLSYVLTLSTVNGVYVYQLSSSTLTLLNHYVSSNITVISVLSYGNTLQIYWLNNYGNQSEPSLNLNLAYMTIAYNVTFTESGLPSGTTWYVNLSNGQSFSSTTSTISFSEPNGSYSYTFATADKIYSPSPSSGSFTVNGASVSESIAFSKVTYSVKFSETGLPSGTTWYVNLSNGVDSGAIIGTSYTFSLTNGTYSYTIATTDKIYESSPSSGSFTVNGGSVSKSVSFSEVKYTVTFTETGLSSGTTWYVNLSNGMDSGAIIGSSYSFSLTNGTYSYKTSNVSGYSVMPSSGSITINGSSISKTITYKATSTPPGKTSPSGISSTEIYGIIGAVIAVAAIGAGITVYRKRR